MTKNAQFLDPAEIGLTGKSLQELIEEMQAIYLDNDYPWVVGFSGGKDSTAVLQLTYMALQQLKPAQRTKKIYIVSSDTLVETPLVVDMFVGTLQKVEDAAQKEEIPIFTARVHPDYKDTFWVNLLGRGYPAPTKTFRWCTDRIKIQPVSQFIEDTVNKHGAVVVVLGARSSESASRAQVIKERKEHAKKAHLTNRNRLTSHTSLCNAYVYTPIEDWTTDNVWRYLFSGAAPWGGDHQKLFNLYKDSNAGECPLVVDTNTPSCGNSRFGCWICTVVTEDRSLKGLIDSGETWLRPLHEFRNRLYITTIPENKNTYRNYKRRSGRVNISETGDSHIPGPYWLTYRKQWLKEILEIERDFKNDGKDITLITEPELHEIRKEWILDPNEPDWEDSVPRIYREVYGADLKWVESDAGAFTKHDAELLQILGKEHGVASELVMKLLEVELSLDALSKRSGVLNKIDQIMGRDWGALPAVLEKQRNIGHRINIYEQRVAELKAIYEDLQK